MYLIEQRWLSNIKFEEVSPNTNLPRYYNINIVGFVPWHATESGVKTVGEKISKANKGKKFGPRDPSVGQKISETKKAKFEERQQQLGYKFSDEHREKLADGRRDKSHTEEWKLENSKRMKEQWSNGTRKRADPNPRMTKEEQAGLSSTRLKSKWSDPEWAARQREALSLGAKSRPPRSAESKLKARLAQLGKPKIKKVINTVEP